MIINLPVPLPIGWHLLAEVQCPSCQKGLRFDPDQHGRDERDAHCDNSNCPQCGIVYILRISMGAIEIKGVRNGHSA